MTHGIVNYACKLNFSGHYIFKNTFLNYHFFSTPIGSTCWQTSFARNHFFGNFHYIREHFRERDNCLFLPSEIVELCLLPLQEFSHDSVNNPLKICKPFTTPITKLSY